MHIIGHHNGLENKQNSQGNFLCRLNSLQSIRFLSDFKSGQVNNIFSYVYTIITAFSYGLFAALSTLLKSDIAEYLQTMMHFMILSLKTTEGVKVGNLLI